MTEREYLLLLAYVKSFGLKILRRIYLFLGSAEKMFALPDDFFFTLSGLRKDKLTSFLKERKKLQEEFPKISENLRKKGILFTTIIDDNYPELLKEIYDPPLVLFYKGVLENEKKYPLAVVGTRKITAYGKKVTEAIIGGLNDEFEIISGLALGVDAVAHKSALDKNIKTVAVLGCGVDYIYPARNKQIYYEIIEKGGAVVSEFVPMTAPERYNFPMRNRIISGISKGVLVVEAAKKSGSLITARTALSQNRDLFAVPGNIFSPGSEGVHTLLKEGAYPIVSSDDLFEYWKIKKAKQMELLLTFDLTEDEKMIINLLTPFEPLTIDEIFFKLEGRIPLAQLISTVTKLKINGFIEELPGKQFVVYNKGGV